MYDSIGSYDWQTIFGLCQAIAWTFLVGMGIVFLNQTKSKLLTKRNKQIIWVIFTIWAVASIGLGILSTYSYFNNRASLERSLNQQVQAQTGL